MNNQDYKEWEDYGECVKRMKVDGGYIYRTMGWQHSNICFVPEIDLQRYQSHLRDAYNQGFEEGKNEASFNLERSIYEKACKYDELTK